MNCFRCNQWPCACGDKQTLICADNRVALAELPEKHFHCCVTSPPYWGLRDYQVDGQIGLEQTMEDYILTLLEVFAGVWRVLRDDGVLWLNLGDSYHGSWGNSGARHGGQRPRSVDKLDRPSYDQHTARPPTSYPQAGLKPKDLCGVPWRVALALQAAGWYLRSDVIWHKPAPMPGSQRDRCTVAHEYVFQLTKSGRYFFDLEAVRESARKGAAGSTNDNKRDRSNGNSNGLGASTLGSIEQSHGRTPRTVWRIPHEGFSEAHFATFPVALAAKAIKAATSERGCCAACGKPWERIVERTALTRERPNELTKRIGENGTGNHCANTVAGVSNATVGWRRTCEHESDAIPCRVLDPFGGAATTLLACKQLGLVGTAIELSPEYCEIAARRLRKPLTPTDAPKVTPAPGQKELW